MRCPKCEAELEVVKCSKCGAEILVRELVRKLWPERKLWFPPYWCREGKERLTYLEPLSIPPHMEERFKRLRSRIEI